MIARRARMAVAMLIVTASAQAANPPDTIEARVQGCSTCHGTAGQGTQDQYFPRIAGKPAGYIFNQLQSFREGRRSYPPMNYLLAYLNDDYFQEIAVFFSERRLPFGEPEHSTLPATELAVGENLVKQGDGARRIPACIACHGPQLTGINPGIPGLIGLHSRYISAQLAEWRAGTRHANAPDCMHDIASRLSDNEVTAVAAWLATQPAPNAPVAAPANSWITPLICGSQPQ
jgi:cytochrome c553